MRSKSSSKVLLRKSRNLETPSDPSAVIPPRAGKAVAGYSASIPSRVRCVRGNGTGEAFSDPALAPSNQYNAISTDEVQDNYTGLIWQRTGNSSGLIAPPKRGRNSDRGH